MVVPIMYTLGSVSVLIKNEKISKITKQNEINSAQMTDEKQISETSLSTKTTSIRMLMQNQKLTNTA